MPGAFGEFALLLLLSAGAGVISLGLRQPLLIAYIVIGIVAGPAVLGLVTAQDQIDLLAQVGVAVLLFVVGLKLDLPHVRHIGPVALATGLGQLAFTIVIGFAISLALGKGWLEALYVAVALTFSSTIIIVKLLSDKRELDSLHGRIAVGFLIVQDLAVVVAMMVMSTLRGGGQEGAWLSLGASLALRVGIAGVILYVCMRHVLPRVVARMAQSQELLMIFAVAWGTGFAALGDLAGFSKEAGAFLAGFSLASTHYRDAINARLSGIRDFLLLFFFIDLGSKLDFSTLGEELWPAMALSAFVLVGNPLIVMTIMGHMGYRKRTGFLCGLTVAQISEFSIIFVAMGISLGHVGGSALGLVTLVGLVTIAVSTYMILYSHPLYERLAPLLGVFERKTPFRELAVATERQDAPDIDVLVFGLGRYGSHLAAGLRRAGLEVVGADFDPEVVSALRQQGLPVRYGDCTAEEFLATLPLRGLRWVVSTLPDPAANRDLRRGLSELGFAGEFALVSRDESGSATFEQVGASVIVHPMRDAVDHAVETLARIIHPPEVQP